MELSPNNLGLDLDICLKKEKIGRSVRKIEDEDSVQNPGGRKIGSIVVECLISKFRKAMFRTLRLELC